MAISVYLGHLGYQTKGIETHSFPLNIGYLKAYARHHLGDEVDIRLFTHVDRICEALNEQTPDVLGLSNYVWNSAVSDRLFKYAKALSSDIVTIQGGPNYPAAKTVGHEFWSPKKDHLDFYLHGEGEEAMRLFLEAMVGGKTSKLLNHEITIPGFDYWCNETQTPIMGIEHPRIPDIDANIPSPILSGDLDEFILSKPMLQTTRGCPYACTFCHEAQTYYNKLYSMSFERVIEEIEYLRRIGNPHAYLNITDSNFGILKRDVDVVNYLAKSRRDRGWPVQLGVSTAKRPSQEFLDAVQNSDGLVRIGLFFQSTNADTLKIIKRVSPSKLEVDRFKAHLSEDKYKYATDTALIIPMPEETFDSFLEAMRATVDDYRASEGTVATMMIFWSIPFEDPKFQEHYDMTIKYRFSEGSFGEFQAFDSCEPEKVCIATNTFSEDEYFRARSIYFFCTVFYFKRNFLLLRRFLQRKNLSTFDWIMHLFEHRNEANAEARAYFDDFDRRTREELFDSLEDIEAFWNSEANRKKIMEEQAVGFNVIHMALGNLADAYENVLEFAHEQTRRYLEKREVKFGGELDDIFRCMQHTRLSKLTETDIDRDITGEFTFDIVGWQKDDFQKELSSYASEEKVRISFRFPEVQKKELLSAISSIDPDNKSERSKFYYRIRPEKYNREMVRI